MPLTSKGSEILSNMEKEYGPEHGKSVFYASRNKGTISGVDSALPARDIEGEIEALAAMLMDLQARFERHVHDIPGGGDTGPEETR